MPPSYITAEGLQIPTVEELKARLAAGAKSTVDELIITESDSVAGEQDGIYASHLREAYEVVQIGFNAVNPQYAEDERLDGVMAITGTTRNPATYSMFGESNALEVELEDLGTVTAGVTMFAVEGDGETRFVATETFQNTTGSTAFFPIAARAEVTGPVVVNANTLTVIATPTTGILSVNNPSDATLGADTEGNAAARVRREAELRAPGSRTVAALKAQLIAFVNADKIHPILAAEIIENTGDTTDALGIPAHSYEPIVWDGTSSAAEDHEVLEIIERNRPDGTKVHGEITDSRYPYSAFSRPEQIQILMIVTLKKKPAEYVGDAGVEALLVATGRVEQKPAIGGASGVVAFSDYLASAWSAKGVTRVTSVVLSYSGVSPVTNADLTIPARSIAVIDTSNIAIISSDETA